MKTQLYKKRTFSLVVLLMVSSCGVGGGGGSAPVVSYGALEGYVFAPYGSGRVAAAAAGYKPLSGATVTVKKNLSEKSAIRRA